MSERARTNEKENNTGSLDIKIIKKSTEHYQGFLFHFNLENCPKFPVSAIPNCFVNFN